MTLLLLCAPALADDTYWRLRDRLTTEFLVVTEEPGGSIPATRRVDTTASMKWADATIQLGWYVGALAIEEALLRDALLPGFDQGGARTADGSARELALALGAFDRLDDHAADGFPDCAGPWGLDGFFVRDDVPADFGAQFDGISTIESDWIDPTLTNKEESQDQLIHVLLGLAIVARVTDPELEVDGVRLRDQAVATAARFGAHAAADGEWVIRNPGCEDRAVNRGEAAQFFSTAIAATVASITGEAPAEGLFADAWEASADPDFPAWDNSDNLHMALALATAGDAWGEPTGPRIVTLAEAHRWEAYPALHAFLHGASADVDMDALEGRLSMQLDEIGEGDPASPWPSGPTSNGWTTWHRYIVESDEQYVGSSGSTGYAYPGTDWLLARMAYAAVWEVDWPVAAGDVPAEEEAVACGCDGGSAAWLVFAPVVGWRRRRER